VDRLDGLADRRGSPLGGVPRLKARRRHALGVGRHLLDAGRHLGRRLGRRLDLLILVGCRLHDAVHRAVELVDRHDRPLSGAARLLGAAGHTLHRRRHLLHDRAGAASVPFQLGAHPVQRLGVPGDVADQLGQAVHQRAVLLKLLLVLAKLVVERIGELAQLLRALGRHRERLVRALTAHAECRDVLGDRHAEHPVQQEQRPADTERDHDGDDAQDRDGERGAGPSSLNVSLQAGVHLLLELRDRRHDRLLVLLVLGVEQQLTGALELLLVLHGRLDRLELVRRDGRRHRPRRRERTLRLQCQPHRVDFGVRQRLGLLLPRGEEVELLLGGLERDQASHDPLARLRDVDLFPVAVEGVAVVADDELPGVAREVGRDVRQVDAQAARLCLPADGVLLLLDRAADEIDASSQKNGQDQKDASGGDADRRLLHGHCELVAPLPSGVQTEESGWVPAAQSGSPTGLSARSPVRF